MSSLLLGLFISGTLFVFIGLIFLLRLSLPPSRGWPKVYIGAAMILFGRFINLWTILAGDQMPTVLNASNRIVLEGAVGYLGGIIFVLAGFVKFVDQIFLE